MRKRQLSIALLVASACPVMGSAYADNVWQGSYSADGQCFCSGEVPKSIASRIVPTPIGGQTVKQVCAQLGQGPGLVKQNGLFNHTVYKDPQCGNGPFVNNSGPRDAKCVGSLDGTYASCQSAGPAWELAVAYAAPGTPAAALPDADVSTTTEDEQSTASKVSTANELTVDNQDGDDAQNQMKIAALEGKSTQSASGKGTGELTGISVMLGDDRFFQARTGIPAQGGAPGSRVILDGMVYLKDDGTLQAEDLYRETDSPELAAATPESTVAVVADVKKKTEEPLVVKAAEKPEANNTASDPAEISGTALREASAQRAQSEVAEKADNAKQLFDLKKQQELRASRARVQMEIEKQARVARLVEEQQTLAKQEAAAEQKNVAEEKVIAEKAKLLDDRMRAERKRLALQQAREAREQRDLNPASSAAPAAESIAAATDAVKADSSDAVPGAESAVVTALRLPAHTRASSRNFAYVEALPTSYDIGGNGLMLEGSAQRLSRIQFVGKLGVTDSFHELMVGAGYYVTPASATRMTLVLLAGIEYGSFELTDEARQPGLTVTSSDSGFYLGAMSRFVVNNKFELKGGVGFSSFFEGDATLMGGGYYHVTPRLDVMSRFEIGDNDSLGIGIRYYY